MYSHSASKASTSIGRAGARTSHADHRPAPSPALPVILFPLFFPLSSPHLLTCGKPPSLGFLIGVAFGCIFGALTALLPGGNGSKTTCDPQRKSKYRQTAASHQRQTRDKDRPGGPPHSPQFALAIFGIPFGFYFPLHPLSCFHARRSRRSWERHHSQCDCLHHCLCPPPRSWLSLGKYKERQRFGKKLEDTAYPFAISRDNFPEFSLKDFGSGCTIFSATSIRRRHASSLLSANKTTSAPSLSPPKQKFYARLYDRYDGKKIADDTREYLENFTRIVHLLGKSFPNLGVEILLHDLRIRPAALVALENNVTGRRLPQERDHQLGNRPEETPALTRGKIELRAEPRGT